MHKPAFQRRHYRLVADVLRKVAQLPHDNAAEALLDVQQELSDAFRRDNGRFRPGQFFQACDPAEGAR